MAKTTAKTKRLFVAAILSATATALTFASCTSTPRFAKLEGQRISMMTFNVENLFDTNHDKGTEDYTFLPLWKKNIDLVKKGCEANSVSFRRKECLTTDWSEEALNVKLARVGTVIRQVGNGKGPDILTLAEVENQRVLDLLLKQELKDSGYVTAKVIDSFDPRGIDPGVVSRFPMWREPKIHKIPLVAEDKAGEWSAQKTRGILEVPVTLPDGTKAVVFALHFASQQNPTYLRKQSVEFLNKLVSELPPDVVAFAGGDFNITRSENETSGYFSKILASEWQVAHLEGCRDCEGTHSYNSDWSFLDSLLVRKSTRETTGWRLDPASVRVPNEVNFQVSPYGGPAKFNAKSPYGVSDHFPLYAEFVKVAKSTDGK